MSKSSNKKALKILVKELKTAVKEYNGDFEGLVHYVMSEPYMCGVMSDIEAEEEALISAKATKLAARAAKKAAKPVELDAEGNPIVRKRGRPKGSKNRSRVVENPPTMPASPQES